MSRRSNSVTGQRYRNTSVSVDMDVDIDEFSTLDLIDELAERAEKGDEIAKKWIRSTPFAPAWAPGLEDLTREDVERALWRKDFDALERWLMPQIRAGYPKPKFVSIDGDEARTATTIDTVKP